MTGKIANSLGAILGFLFDFLTWPHKTSNDEVRGAVGSLLQLGAVILATYQIFATEPIASAWVVSLAIVGLVLYLFGYNQHRNAKDPSRSQINVGSCD